MTEMPRDFTPQYEYPGKLEPLFQPMRYKVLHGGRGGAKSWGIARALLEMGVGKSIRVGCFREIQKSIKESVHALLKSQIEAMGLGWAYEVQEARIFSKIPGNTTEFVFSGLRSLNVENIKSFEGLDIAWVEEARNVSKKSWDVLIPTIRKEDKDTGEYSEIWISLNPELDTDETYKRFILDPPKKSVVIEIGWRDNPWFPQVLEDERRDMERRDPDGYLTTWEGKTRIALEGAVYAKELREAVAQGRVCNVPLEATRPVHTFWDLGYSDATAIWFVQVVGFEYRVVDFYQAYSQPLPHYLKVLQNKGYLWGTDWMPHDGRHKQIQTGRSIVELMEEAGRTVRVTPSIPVSDGINAARTLFPKLYFDEKRTLEGRNCLARYCYDIDENGTRSRLPLHDENSHAADALRYLAVALDAHGADRASNGNYNYPTTIRRGIV